jgi:hypothetical protein
MTEVLLLARIVFVPSCLLLAFLGLVLHEFIPKRTLLLVVILKIWREALFDVVFFKFA